MDLAQDILRIAEKVAQVPGLSAACTLTMTIIKTVQISKNNTARLQYLAHSIADHLVTIAEHTAGRWDTATDSLKQRIDEFEGVLGDIAKLVAKYSKLSHVVALLNAGDRDMVIRRLEQRLADARKSILILLGVDASLSLHNIETAVNISRAVSDSLALQTRAEWQDIRNAVDQVQLSLKLQGTRVEDTYSKVENIEDGIRGHSTLASFSRVENTDVLVYTRDDLRILETMSRRYAWSRDGRRLTGTLKKAQHRTSKQVVLVRTYEDSDPNERIKTFSRDLSLYHNVWEASILQLVGKSESTSHIPFQVYDSPDGQVEDSENWIERTLESHPVETIFGLYEMRSSIKALVEFQNSRGVGCWYPFENSIVNMQSNGNRRQWALIYTGEIEDRPSSTVVGDYNNILVRLETRAWEVVQAFGHQSKAWMNGATALDAFLDRGIQNVDITTLYSALLENGWLGTCLGEVPCNSIVGLGDVGYMTNDGHFIVVTNIHSLLSSVDGGALTWDTKLTLNNTPDDTTVVERSGQSYNRHKYRILSSESCYYLKYTNLNERHAWKVLQRHACSIITRFSPSTSPCDLKLITSTNKWEAFRLVPFSYSDVETFEADKEPNLAEEMPSVLLASTDVYSAADTKALGMDDAGSCSYADTDLFSDTRNSPPLQLIQQPPFPPSYVFLGDALHIRDSGVPELLPCFRESFQTEPDWLDNEDPFVFDRANGLEFGTEIKDGFMLSQGWTGGITYLRLPEGVALPYLEEVDSS